MVIDAKSRPARVSSRTKLLGIAALASPEALQKSSHPSGGPPPALQKSAETLMADYFTISLRWRINDVVADTLMRSFGVIMFDIILDHIA